MSRIDVCSPELVAWTDERLAQCERDFMDRLKSKHAMLRVSKEMTDSVPRIRQTYFGQAAEVLGSAYPDAVKRAQIEALCHSYGKALAGIATGIDMQTTRVASVQGIPPVSWRATFEHSGHLFQLGKQFLQWLLPLHLFPRMSVGPQRPRAPRPVAGQEEQHDGFS